MQRTHATRAQTANAPRQDAPAPVPDVPAVLPAVRGDDLLRDRARRPEAARPRRRRLRGSRSRPLAGLAARSSRRTCAPWPASAAAAGYARPPLATARLSRAPLARLPAQGARVGACIGVFCSSSGQIRWWWVPGAARPAVAGRRRPATRREWHEAAQGREGQPQGPRPDPARRVLGRRRRRCGAGAVRAVVGVGCSPPRSRCRCWPGPGARRTSAIITPGRRSTPRFRVLNADVVLRAYYAAGLGHPDKPGQQVTFGVADGPRRRRAPGCWSTCRTARA